MRGFKTRRKGEKAMKDTNRVILTGRMVRDPDIRWTQGAQQYAVAEFAIAVDRGKRGDGTDMGTDFPNCKCFGKLAEIVDKYAYKGMWVLIDGHIQTGKYTNKEGKNVYTQDVVAEDVTFLTYKDKDAIDKGKQERRDAAAVNQEIDGGYEDAIPEGFSKLELDIPF